MTVPSSTSTSLTITNPLVHYRTLIATKRLKPDPAQLRVAIHLQKLYFELKDYKPDLEYRDRLDTIARVLGKLRRPGAEVRSTSSWRSLWSGAQRDGPTLDLTLSKNDIESVHNVSSPKGLLLHGEVGTGKTMLVDLLANSLPTERKRRWHFNNFMLEIIRELEKQRLETSQPTSFRDPYEENSVFTLARHLASTTPIIFLDEFQLPDRASSRILCSLLVGFFQMGGVLIATSNRIPEDLARASGRDFRHFKPFNSGVSQQTVTMTGSDPTTSVNQAAKSNDFPLFLEILKLRCDTWEMEGYKDWRREEDDEPINAHLPSLNASTIKLDPISKRERAVRECRSKTCLYSASTPTYFLVSSGQPSSTADEEHKLWEQVVSIVLSEGGATPQRWHSSHITVYGRKLHIPRQQAGMMMWDFEELCGSNLGPADYISLAASYHTLILDKVPSLSSDLRNEARRFISLLDALYEAGCRLLIRASTNIDDLFFPENNRERASAPKEDGDDDNIWQESLSEIYQDMNFPFRPNTALYDEKDALTEYEASQDKPTKRVASILSSASVSQNPSNPDTVSETGAPATEKPYNRDGLDFTRPRLYIGEDEKFAFRRAQSRIWEMTGSRWWNKSTSDRWKPLKDEHRHWESPFSKTDTGFVVNSSPGGTRYPVDQDENQNRAAGRPPNFSWVHAWGMMKWGKKAGRWGQGPEGIKDAKQHPSKE